MIRSGLVSITFRKLRPEAVVGLVARAGLEGIEWGGDVHVPHGDVACARDVGAMTAAAGLQVSSYGSYYRAGVAQDFSFSQVLDTAVALGAPLIRIWAGDRGSDPGDAAWRARVARDTREACIAATGAGVRVAFEFHRNTLTDNAKSALDLVSRVDHPGLSLYWQPPTGLSDSQLRDSLHTVLPFLANLHVFHWGPKGERRPLAEGGERWRALFSEVRQTEGSADRWALIEFVQDDSPACFLEDARTARQLLDACLRKSSSANSMSPAR